MSRKLTQVFEFICRQCGKVVPPDASKSNENWNVSPDKCPYYGGKVTIKFKGMEKKDE